MNLFHFVSYISANFDKYLYIYLFFLLFIEEAGIPLPVSGDVYTFLAGYQVIRGNGNPILIVLDTTVASMLGASALFFLVSKKGEPLVERYGKYILLSNAKLDRGKRWFSKYGEAVIFFGRWIPGLRIVMTIVGGIFNLEYYKFLLAMVLSTIIWSSTFLYLGITFGKQHKRILHMFNYINPYLGYIVYVAGLLVVCLILYQALRSYRRSKAI